MTSLLRVLIVAISRINAADTANNALLLRNLLSTWPKENLAQIYSGGSNGDQGFFGHQYQLTADDRRLGKFFVKLKKEQVSDLRSSFADNQITSTSGASLLSRVKSTVGSFIQDSGLYELIFKVKPSEQLFDWVREFDPDIILAQGYNLSFTWLPLMLKRELNKPLAFYNSDDWPTYLYSSRKGLYAITAPFVRSIVARSTNDLIASVDVPFAFNDMMGEEYERRYGKTFTTLMHCDDPERFIRAESIRLQPPEVKSIIATGAFDDSRWPLLLDLEQACQRLNDMGIPTRATVLATRISEEGFRMVKSCRFVKLQDDPGHEMLPSYLKGADLLYLPETFDPEVAHGYKYSISTKAHLFMFSQKPILVYGHRACGLVQYADRYGWAYVVKERDSGILAAQFGSLLTDNEIRKDLIRKSSLVANLNNNSEVVRKVFCEKLLSVYSGPQF
ncbi:MAG: glycosyltransferase [Chlorobium sp.]|nr:glycosyltransferase [Chlorobium sp.]